MTKNIGESKTGYLFFKQHLRDYVFLVERYKKNYDLDFKESTKRVVRIINEMGCNPGELGL